MSRLKDLIWFDKLLKYSNKKAFDGTRASGY